MVKSIHTILVLLAALKISAGSWPEFRGPTAQGHANAQNVPIHWNATTNIAWKSTIPGKGWSSPVIDREKVFLTTAVQEGSEVSLRVLCLDESSGKILWNREVLKAGPEQAKQIHNKNSLASPTPIVRDGRIYAHFGHMGTAALDLAGKILWTQDSIKYPPVHGNGASPLLTEDLLVFSCDGASDPFLVALEAKSGKERWRTARNTTAKSKFSFATPLEIEVSGKKMIISPTSGFVGGYDHEGKELWRIRYGEGYSVVPRPVFGHGLLYLGSGFDRPVVYAIDPAGAKGDASETHVRWTNAKGAPNTPSLLLAGDELYMVSDGGVASCLDAKTGDAHWTERLGGNFSASPVMAEGRIYFVNESGVTSVLRAGKTFELLAKNDLGERTLASPAVLDGTIFIRTDSHLWRIGR